MTGWNVKLEAVFMTNHWIHSRSFLHNAFLTCIALAAATALFRHAGPDYALGPARQQPARIALDCPSAARVVQSRPEYRLARAARAHGQKRQAEQILSRLAHCPDLDAAHRDYCLNELRSLHR